MFIGQEEEESEEEKEGRKDNRYSKRRAAQKIIPTATEKSGNKRKRTSETDAEREQILKEVFDDLTAGSGSSFIPIGTASSAPVSSPQRSTRRRTAYSPAGTTKKGSTATGKKPRKS